MLSDPSIIETDVIVIGGGRSGLAVAAEAAQLGGSGVVLVEKEPSLGGSNAHSVGSISKYATQTGSRHQIYSR